MYFKQTIIVIVILFNVILGFSQTTIKLMSYNLLKYPYGVNGIDRKDDLRYILNQYEPDIFMVCELQDEQGANEILDYCLSTPDNRYSAASFEYNHSGLYRDLQQMLYYNNQVFELLSQTYVTTYLRDINRYTLKLLSIDTNNPVVVEVYVAHLKASQGTDNENKRLDMVTDFANDLNNIPSNHYVIFAGDFNLYRSNEPAYEKVTDTNNAIIMNDPITCTSSTCFWHNNISFAPIHTQSTHTQSTSSYVGGGLDDRFDFIFLSENTFNNPEFQYINNTYTTVGNNGNCFDKRINDTTCGTSSDMTLRQHLYNMSDHLPVVLELETNQILSNPALSDFSVRINEALPVFDQISFSGDFKQINLIEIYDISGKIVISKKNYIKNSIINLQFLKKGIYFVKLNDLEHQKIFKFAKDN